MKPLPRCRNLLQQIHCDAKRPVSIHGPPRIVPRHRCASGAVVAAAGDVAGVAGGIEAGGAGAAAGAAAGVLVAVCLAGEPAHEPHLFSHRRLFHLLVGRGAHGSPRHAVRRGRERLHGQVLEIQLQLAHGCLRGDGWKSDADAGAPQAAQAAAGEQFTSHNATPATRLKTLRRSPSTRGQFPAPAASGLDTRAATPLPSDHEQHGL